MWHLGHFSSTRIAVPCFPPAVQETAHRLPALYAAQNCLLICCVRNAVHKAASPDLLPAAISNPQLCSSASHCIAVHKAADLLRDYLRKPHSFFSKASAVYRQF